MDRFTPSTERTDVPAPVNLDPPVHESPPHRESGIGQDPVAPPTQAENVPRVDLDKDAVHDAERRGDGFENGLPS